MLDYVMDVGAQARLVDYFHRLGGVLRNKKRRASFAVYAMGLLGEGERKSVEPMAARAAGGPEEVDALHQRLLHFMVDSKWSDRDVRREAAAYALEALTAREPVEAWIVDDTGFLKQGSHSVGVQRQYTGSAGKVANCQLGVSLTIATRTEQLPIDFELYLPEAWAQDEERRREAHIPQEVRFQTKPELALAMIRRALKDGVPKGLVLADTAYGSSADFRAELRRLDLTYAVAVDSRTTVLPVSKSGRRAVSPISVRDFAFRLDARGAFRRCTWREGTKEDLSARFAMRRVIPAHDRKGEEVWLLVEWRDGEAEPANFFLATLPRTVTRTKLVRLVMQRWRTERIYEDLKGELGLDHYEGRRFGGWHHHVSVVLCCYAFLTAERVRHFPPSARGTAHAHPHALPA
jgi:SRSO17 transposase